MTDLPTIREGMQVYGSCGGRVGVVDGVQGEAIRLGPDAGGGPHYIPVEWVQAVGDGVIHLSKTCDEVTHLWAREPVEAGG